MTADDIPIAEAAAAEAARKRYVYVAFHWVMINVP
jgi:hypothetical protein